MPRTTLDYVADPSVHQDDPAAFRQWLANTMKCQECRAENPADSVICCSCGLWLIDTFTPEEDL